MASLSWALKGLNVSQKKKAANCPFIRFYFAGFEPFAGPPDMDCRISVSACTFCIL